MSQNPNRLFNSVLAIVLCFLAIVILQIVVLQLCYLFLAIVILQIVTLQLCYLFLQL